MTVVVITRVVRYGAHSVNPGEVGEPDLYGHVVRVSWHRVNWSVTDGVDGQVLITGHAWTKNGALAKAVIAATTDPYVLGMVREIAYWRGER